MTAWLTLVLHAALVAAAAPLLEGWNGRVRAAWAKRSPPPLLQPWRDLRRQWRKPPLRPAGAAFVVAIAPPVAAGAATAAALLVPSFALGMATAGAADLLVIAGLLGLSRFAVALAALDTGAAMPANDAASARLRAEPVLLLVALVVAVLSGGTNLDAAAMRDTLAATRLPGLLAGAALLAAVAIEPAAPAVFSGRDLALVGVAAQLRRVAGLSLAAVIGAPLGLAPPAAGPDAWLAGAALWALKLGIAGAVATTVADGRALPAAALLALIAAVIAGIGSAA